MTPERFAEMLVAAAKCCDGDTERLRNFAQDVIGETTAHNGSGYLYAQDDKEMEWLRKLLRKIEERTPEND